MKGQISNDLVLKKWSMGEAGRSLSMTLHGSWEGEMPSGVSEMRLDAVRGAKLCLRNEHRKAVPGTVEIESTKIGVTIKKGEEEVFAKIRLDVTLDAQEAQAAAATLTQMAQLQHAEIYNLRAKWKFQGELPLEAAARDPEGEG